MGVFDKGNILLPSLEFFPVERSLPDDDLYFGLLVLHEFKYDGQGVYNKMSMFFCCGKKEKQPIIQPKSRTESRKRDTIVSAWQIPVPQSKNIAVLKKPTTSTQSPQPDPQLAHLQNNCQLILFNTKQGSELFLSFAVKKTIMNVTRESKGNYNSVDEQLYEILAKRSKESDTLVVTEQSEEVMERKYRKYQQGYVMVAVVPMQHHFQAKFNKSKVGYVRAGSFDEEGTGSRRVGSSMNQGMLINKEREKFPFDCIPFSHATQLRLGFFDHIYVYSPVCKDGIGHSTMRWLQTIVNNIHTLPILQKTTLILPKQIRLIEIMQILQQLMHEKIKSETLEVACNMIHFQLECIYSELTFTKVIVRKRFEQGDLTIMLLAINLLLIQFNSVSQQYYSIILQHLKKVTFKQYTLMKSKMKQGHNTKRALQKLLRQHRLMTQQQLKTFRQRFGQMTRLPDSWASDWRYTFTVLRDLRVELSEFLRCRVFIPACSYHVLNEHMQVVEQAEEEVNNAYTLEEEEIIVPSYREEMEKEDMVKYSLLNHEVRIDIEVEEEEGEGNKGEQQPASQKKSSIDDYELQSPRKVTARRKNSNDY